jgi:hypothetical protein
MELQQQMDLPEDEENEEVEPVETSFGCSSNEFMSEAIMAKYNPQATAPKLTQSHPQYNNPSHNNTLNSSALTASRESLTKTFQTSIKEILSELQN